MFKLSNIPPEQINRRNQIEMYLNEIYSPGHFAIIDSNNRFNVTKNSMHMFGFHIVYIKDSFSILNHSVKVNEFPDIVHVTFKEIRNQLFTNII